MYVRVCNQTFLQYLCFTTLYEYKERYASDNTTKRRQQLGLALHYVQHQKKVVSDNTEKERHNFSFCCRVSYVSSGSYVTTRKKKSILIR
jgi:hypothetical protein